MISDISEGLMKTNQAAKASLGELLEGPGIDQENETTPTEKELSIANGKDVEALKEEEKKESWRSPRRNVGRVAACYFALMALGMNDATIGVLLPSLEDYYNLDHLVASLAFMAPFCGYVVVALLNDFLHRKIGRWGVFLFSTSCHLIGFIICITAPPFPVFIIGYLIIGFGGGGIDGSVNVFIGGLRNANQLMGLLHAFYGIGGILTPAIFQAMVASGVEWNICYSVLIGIGAIDLVAVAITFYGESGEVYREMVAKGGETKSSIRVVVASLTVWIIAISLFLYIGAEVTIGGWTSTFMIDVRGGDVDKMGYVTTGFWIGIALGRAVLGYVTEYFKHEEWCLLGYYILVCAFLLVYWLVKNLVASAVAVALAGFWSGPAFPIVVVVAMRKLPKWLHVSGVGFAAALAGSGGALLPFIFGIIADHVGVRAVGPYVFAMFVGITVLWIYLMSRSARR